MAQLVAQRYKSLPVHYKASVLEKGCSLRPLPFTKDSLDYVTHIDSKIILIEGEQLARLMVEHDVGVSTVGQYAIKEARFRLL